MSILIKGIEMPKSCGECCDKYNICTSNLRDYDDYVNIPPPDCPLVEVPTPHGQLIDRDDLLYEINRSTFVERYDYNTAYDTAALAETIIEAEE